MHIILLERQSLCPLNQKSLSFNHTRFVTNLPSGEVSVSKQDPILAQQNVPEGQKVKLNRRKLSKKILSCKFFHVKKQQDKKPLLYLGALQLAQAVLRQ